MSSSPHPTHHRRRFALSLAETLAIAGLGGAIFGLSGFPAGWLSGSMLFVAIAAIAGRPAHVPQPLARAIFIVIGISLGAVATPQTLKGIWAWPASIAVLMLAVLAVTFATASYLKSVHKWDRMSAFLAAAPGALSQVIIVSTQYNADVRGIAIVQSVRVVILAVALPAAIALLGLAAPAPLPLPVAVDNPAFEYGTLILVSIVAAFGLEYVRFRGGLMFGAMLASAVLHGTGFIHAVMPWWIAAVAMCGLGAITGSRFANTGPKLLMDYLGAALGSFVISICVAGAFALGLIALTTFRAADVIASFAPGALDVMMILALALHLDPIYVGAHHLARFLLISVALPFAARSVYGKA
ncbi:MAG TPA: AbrB family transcriptional regulator [Pseudorhodoplanes sp.]|jgi:membrane AbrB-like protein|nr:AbrB family transcriptional regulator [Pseudorhodoplanes sp.]